MDSFLSRSSGDLAPAASATDLETEASSGYGHGGSGYGHGGGYPTFVYKEEEECDDELNPFLILGTLALAAAAIGVLFLQVGGGRRKKRELREGADDKSWAQFLQEMFTGFVWSGLEDFENKVDSIAAKSSVDSDDNSWLNKLYKNLAQMKNELHEEEPEDEFVGEDGLEPPMLVNENQPESPLFKTLTKRSVKKSPKIQKEEQMLKDIYNEEGTCQMKLWKCLANVVEGGLEYGEQAGGFTRAMKKNLMKIVFNGGNVWKGLMKVPEARKLQRCYTFDQDCKSYETLAKAANTEQDQPRLIVVPDQ